MEVLKIAEEEAPINPRISMKEQVQTDEGECDNENRVFSQKSCFFPKTLLTYRTLDSPNSLITWWEKTTCTTAKA